MLLPLLLHDLADGGVLADNLLRKNAAFDVFEDFITLPDLSGEALASFGLLLVEAADKGMLVLLDNVLGKPDFVGGLRDELGRPGLLVLAGVLGWIRLIQVVVLAHPFVVQVFIPEVVCALVWPAEICQVLLVQNLACCSLLPLDLQRYKRLRKSGVEICVEQLLSHPPHFVLWHHLSFLRFSSGLYGLLLMLGGHTWVCGILLLLAHVSDGQVFEFIADRRLLIVQFDVIRLRIEFLRHQQLRVQWHFPILIVKVINFLQVHALILMNALVVL